MYLETSFWSLKNGLCVTVKAVKYSRRWQSGNEKRPNKYQGCFNRSQNILHINISIWNLDNKTCFRGNYAYWISHFDKYFFITFFIKFKHRWTSILDTLRDHLSKWTIRYIFYLISFSKNHYIVIPNLVCQCADAMLSLKWDFPCDNTSRGV